MVFTGFKTKTHVSVLKIKTKTLSFFLVFKFPLNKHQPCQRRTASLELVPRPTNPRPMVVVQLPRPVFMAPRAWPRGLKLRMVSQKVKKNVSEFWKKQLLFFRSQLTKP